MLLDATASASSLARTLSNAGASPRASPRGASGEGGGPAAADAEWGASGPGRMSLWTTLHQRVGSIIIKGDRTESEFDFGQVPISEDLAELRRIEAEAREQAARGGRVSSPGLLDRVERLKRKIKQKVKKERLLEGVQKDWKKFDITVKECIIAICTYLTLSVVAFSFLFEQWPIVDSLYFAVVTFTTIGYGDLTPTTVSGQLFTCLFGLGGVASLGIALGVLGSNLIDSQVKAMDAARKKNQREVMHLFQEDSSTDESKRKKRTKSLVGASEEFWEKLCRSYRSTLSSPVMAVLPTLAALLIGSIVIAIYEEWGWISGVYYAVVTTTTIGYGDLAPSLIGTRLFSVVFVPVAVGAMGQILSTFSNYVIEERQRQFRKELGSHELTLESLQAVSGTGDGVVTRLDFVEFMLLAMQKVDQDLLDELHAQFDRLDVTGEGILSEKHLKAMAKKKLSSAKKKLELAKYKKSLLMTASSKEPVNIGLGGPKATV